MVVVDQVGDAQAACERNGLNRPSHIAPADVGGPVSSIVRRCAERAADPDHGVGAARLDMIYTIDVGPALYPLAT